MFIYLAGQATGYYNYSLLTVAKVKVFNLLKKLQICLMFFAYFYNFQLNFVRLQQWFSKMLDL
jgi:hypothetical protein